MLMAKKDTLSKISEWFINKLLKNIKIYPDGSVVEYVNGKLEIYPSYTTVIKLKGKVFLESDEDIKIQSHKTLYLRGERLEINDHKPFHPITPEIEYEDIKELN